MNIYLIALGRNQVKNSYAKIQLVGRHGKASQLHLHVLYLCAAGEGVQGKPDCLEEEEEFPGLSFWFEAVTLRHDEILETSVSEQRTGCSGMAERLVRDCIYKTNLRKRLQRLARNQI